MGDIKMRQFTIELKRPDKNGWFTYHLLSKESKWSKAEKRFNEYAEMLFHLRHIKAQDLCLNGTKIDLWACWGDEKNPNISLLATTN